MYLLNYNLLFPQEFLDNIILLFALLLIFLLLIKLCFYFIFVNFINAISRSSHTLYIHMV